MKNWQDIQDSDVRMIWRCTDNDCDCDSQESAVDPTFYQDNGSPMCNAGQDMVYIQTEINTNF